MNLSKLLVIAALLFFSTRCLSYGNMNNVRSYYSNTSIAEMFITRADYRKALDMYDLAFKDKAPNARDLFNAYLSSYYIRDTARAIKYFNQLAGYGLRRAVFEDKVLLTGSTVTDIKKDPFYLFISKDYDSVYEAAKKSDMPKKAAILNKILAADQDSRISGDPKNLAHSDSVNIDLLEQYIAEYGFPTLQQVGFFEKSRIGPMMPGTLWMVLWHHRGKPTKLDKKLLEAVKNGDFPPEDYAILADQMKEQYYCKIPAGGMEGLNVNEINDRRAEIYLDTIAQYRNRLNYQNKDRRFILTHFMAFAYNFAKQDK